jgi:hypothetical protein
VVASSHDPLLTPAAGPSHVRGCEPGQVDGRHPLVVCALPCGTMRSSGEGRPGMARSRTSQGALLDLMAMSRGSSREMSLQQFWAPQLCGRW